MPGRTVSGEDYRVGQKRHVGHLGGPLVLVVAVTGGLLAGCGSGDSGITRISKAANAQVITATGRTVAAHAGYVLHNGDEVRTGVDGAVALATGERRSYLGGQASY